MYAHSSQISKDELTSDADPTADISCKYVFWVNAYTCCNRGSGGKYLIVFIHANFQKP